MNSRKEQDMQQMSYGLLSILQEYKANRLSRDYAANLLLEFDSRHLVDLILHLSNLPIIQGSGGVTPVEVVVSDDKE